MVATFDFDFETEIGQQEGGPTVTDSVFLAERLGLEADVVQRLRTAVQANAQLGVVVDGDLWGVPPTRLPLWCSVKAYLWNAVVSLALVLVGTLVLVLVDLLVLEPTD